MITQTKIGLNSRSEANPFNEEGFLPLITAPMYSTVDESNYQLFLDNKIQVCLPRNTKAVSGGNPFFSFSLEKFIASYINTKVSVDYETEITKICIDTANGNMPQLHKAIRKAKEIHGNSLIIMAGNVGSVEAFVELAKTGCDYIRVGIGSGGACNTTSNTGVGQETLDKLIAYCKMAVGSANNSAGIRERKRKEYLSIPDNEYFDSTYQEFVNISKVKIVADGISSYINYCQKEYNFNDNGYAAINKLLHSGADLVMVGKLFAQCVESAGTKRLSVGNEYDWQDGDYETQIIRGWIKRSYYREKLEVKYSGMSTQQEQKKYKDPFNQSIKVFKSNGVLACYADSIEEAEKLTTEHSGWYFTSDLRPSEGSVQWIPVRWSLDEWLNGSNKQDESPYLMGFVNALRSMMAYTGKTKL